MSRKPSLVTLGTARRPFACLVCNGTLFLDREIKLNTTGMEAADLGWLNRSATGLVCARCGYVHLFVNDEIELWRVEGGYPR